MTATNPTRSEELRWRVQYTHLDHLALFEWQPALVSWGVIEQHACLNKGETHAIAAPEWRLK